MTPQEIFDTVAKHLFAQGERAGIQLEDEDGDVGVGFSCRYRAPGGRSCAVGKLIPDDVYTHVMEGTSAEGICEMYTDVLPAWMSDNIGLLIKLQIAHDEKDSWTDDASMKYALGLAADRFKLDKSVLEGLTFGR
jgi:hypothetical protein